MLGGVGVGGVGLGLEGSEVGLLVCDSVGLGEELGVGDAFLLAVGAGTGRSVFGTAKVEVAVSVEERGALVLLASDAVGHGAVVVLKGDGARSRRKHSFSQPTIFININQFLYLYSPRRPPSPPSADPTTHTKVVPALRFIIMRAQKKVITPNQFGIIFGSPANMEIEDQLPLPQTKTKYSSHLRGCGGSGPSKLPLSGTHPPIQSCQYSSTNLFSHRITFRLALRWAKTHRIPKVKVQLFHPLARILAAPILGSAGDAGQEAFIEKRTMLLRWWGGYYRYLGRRGAGGRHYAILFYLKAIRNRMKKDLTCILDGRNGRGAIYISGIDAAMCLDTLKEAHIQAVLSVARAALLPHSPAEVPRYLFLPAEDKETYNIAQHFDETFRFIDQARGHTNVLVHCMAGISRSATVIAAYLIRKWGYSVRGVLDLMQGRREKVCPNRGFIRQLKQIEPRRKQRTIVRKPDNEAASPSQVRSSSHSPSKNPKGSDCLEAERKMTESSFSSQLGDQDMVKFNRSQVIGKGCGTPKLSEAKTAAKIEKLKSSLIQDMLKSRLCPELPSQPQALSFSALLQSKIYKNKLRLRETAPQPIC